MSTQGSLLAQLFILIAALVGPAGSARADDESAKLHFQAGANDFASKRYESALRSFTAAYELSGRPELLYNIALCHEELGQYGDAAVHLRRFLDEVEEIPQRNALERRVEILTAAAARESQSAEPAVEVEATPESEPEPEPRSSPVPGPAWAAFGVSGGALVTGVVLGAVGLSQKKDLESGCGVNASCDRGDVRRMERMGVFADVSFGLTVAAAAVGTALIFLLREDERDGTVSLAPWALRESAGISIAGKF